MRNKPSTALVRKLGLRRETLRRLSVLDPQDLAQVAGGWKRSYACPANEDTFGNTSTIC